VPAGEARAHARRARALVVAVGHTGFIRTIGAAEARVAETGTAVLIADPMVIARAQVATWALLGAIVTPITATCGAVAHPCGGGTDPVIMAWRAAGTTAAWAFLSAIHIPKPLIAQALAGAVAVPGAAARTAFVVSRADLRAVEIPEAAVANASASRQASTVVGARIIRSALALSAAIVAHPARVAGATALHAMASAVITTDSNNNGIVIITSSVDQPDAFLLAIGTAVASVTDAGAIAGSARGGVLRGAVARVGTVVAPVVGAAGAVAGGSAARALPGADHVAADVNRTSIGPRAFPRASCGAPVPVHGTRAIVSVAIVRIELTPRAAE
jgi:hypothetical protein